MTYIVPVTEETRAKANLVKRAQRASGLISRAVTLLETMSRDKLSTMGHRMPEPADVLQAERIVAAVFEALKEEPGA